MQILLETERLALRPLEASDSEELEALHSDPEVMRYLDPSPLPGFFSGHFWAGVEKATGRFVGWFELQPMGERGHELGYRLHTWAWGRGYGTEGAKALVAKGFTEMGAERIFAETMAVNTGSRRVMEKAGLKYVRTHFPHWEDPLPGSEQGEVEYALTRAEFLG